MNDETNHKDALLRERIGHELGHMRHNWLWFLILGLVLIAGGTLAICYPCITSAGAVVMLGSILIIGGIVTIVGAFFAGKWSGFLLQLLVGILYMVTGFMITETPLESAVFLTLFIASFLIVLGIFRVIVSLTERFPQWGWALLNGIVTLLAGVLIYRNFTEAGLWLIGLLVGLELLFNGWSWVMMALAIRQLPIPTTPDPFGDETRGRRRVGR